MVVLGGFGLFLEVLGSLLFLFMLLGFNWWLIGSLCSYLRSLVFVWIVLSGSWCFASFFFIVFVWYMWFWWLFPVCGCSLKFFVVLYVFFFLIFSGNFLSSLKCVVVLSSSLWFSVVLCGFRLLFVIICEILLSFFP